MKIDVFIGCVLLAEEEHHLVFISFLSVAICIDLVSLTSIICSQGYIQIALCEPGVKGIKDDLYTVEIPQDKSQDTQVSLGGKSWRLPLGHCVGDHSRSSKHQMKNCQKCFSLAIIIDCITGYFKK